MKILHLAKFYPPATGGIEQFTYEMACRQKKDGHDITVLCSGTGRQTYEEVFDGVRVIRAGLMGTPGGAPLSPYFYTFLKKHGSEYDIIHVQTPNPFATLFLLMAAPKAKIITHWQSDIVRQKNLVKLYGLVQKRFLDRTDKIITSTEAYLNGSEALKNYRSKTVALTLGMQRMPEPTEETLEKFRDRFAGKKLVLFVGRLVYYKSIDVLINAAKHLDESYEVVIAGDGQLMPVLRQQAENVLHAGITFAGRVTNDEKAALLKMCDVFVLPSSVKTEAFGMVMVEAMQFGRPVICCDIKDSGVSWVNRHGETGLVVAPDDENAMAEAIKAICENEELKKQFSENALKRFESVFSIEKVTKAIEDVYRQQLASF